MKDADDLDATRPETVVDQMMTDMKASMACADMVSIGSEPRIVREAGHALV